MGDDDLRIERLSIRRTDSNSLLRLYDLANAILKRSPLQQERERADRATRRIAEELRKRAVPLE
jgi:hypothetical protein